MRVPPPRRRPARARPAHSPVLIAPRAAVGGGDSADGGDMAAPRLVVLALALLGAEVGCGAGERPARRGWGRGRGRWRGRGSLTPGAPRGEPAVPGRGDPHAASAKPGAEPAVRPGPGRPRGARGDARASPRPGAVVSGPARRRHSWQDLGPESRPGEAPAPAEARTPEPLEGSRRAPPGPVSVRPRGAEGGGRVLQEGKLRPRPGWGAGTRAKVAVRSPGPPGSEREVSGAPVLASDARVPRSSSREWATVCGWATWFGRARWSPVLACLRGKQDSLCLPVEVGFAPVVFRGEGFSGGALGSRVRGGVGGPERWRLAAARGPLGGASAPHG